MLTDKLREDVVDLVFINIPAICTTYCFIDSKLNATFYKASDSIGPIYNLGILAQTQHL